MGRRLCRIKYSNYNLVHATAMSIKHFFAHNQLNFLGKKVHFYVKDNIWLLKMAYEQASLSLGISLFTKKPKKKFHFW